jgi:hypothetical protein
VHRVIHQLPGDAHGKCTAAVNRSSLFLGAKRGH